MYVFVCVQNRYISKFYKYVIPFFVEGLYINYSRFIPLNQEGEKTFQFLSIYDFYNSNSDKCVQCNT